MICITLNRSSLLKLFLPSSFGKNILVIVAIALSLTCFNSQYTVAANDPKIINGKTPDDSDDDKDEGEGAGHAGSFSFSTF